MEIALSLLEHVKEVVQEFASLYSIKEEERVRQQVINEEKMILLGSFVKMDHFIYLSNRYRLMRSMRAEARAHGAAIRIVFSKLEAEILSADVINSEVFDIITECKNLLEHCGVIYTVAMMEE